MIYTKDNPKLIHFYQTLFEGKANFTGVTKDSYGTLAYFLNGKYHREDGPAIENPYRQEWYLHGKLHREDGPAAIYTDGKEWWLNGVRLAEEYSNGLKLWRFTDEHFDNESWIRFVKLELLK